MKLPDPPLILADMANHGRANSNYVNYLLIEIMFIVVIIGVIIVVAMIVRTSISNFKIHQMARAIVPLLKAGEGDTKDKPVTMFHGHRLSDRHVKMLLRYSLSIIGICIIMFFFHYILEKAYACTLSNSFDCFGDGQQLDCENSTELKDVKSIVCYQWSCNVTRALSEVVSVLSISVGYINFVTWILRKAVNLKCMAHKRKRIRYSVVLLLQFVIILVFWTLIFLKPCLRMITRDGPYRTSAHVSDIAEILIYSFVSCIGAEVPWQQFDTVSYNRDSPPETDMPTLTHLA